jgi:hypothetical protein
MMLRRLPFLLCALLLGATACMAGNDPQRAPLINAPTQDKPARETAAAPADPAPPEPTALPATAAPAVSTAATIAAPVLPVIGPAPDWDNEVWINSDRPLPLAELRGKVVLLEFWTFG